MLDHVTTPSSANTSLDAEEFSAHIKEVHGQIKENLRNAYNNYKEAADLHRRHVEFEEGDMVMVYLRKEHFPVGTYHKLKNKKIGPCRISEKYGPNAYRVELPDGMNISPTFNISDLYPYYVAASAHQADSRSSPFHRVENMVQLNSTHNGNVHGNNFGKELTAKNAT